jgi:diacylglycerol kinase
MIRCKRLLQSFHYALKGLAKTFHEEQNLRIQAFLGLAAVLCGWYFCLARWEWMVLIIFILAVLVTEIINSAVERVTDVLKPRIDSYVKEIKDIMAAAVMLVSLAALIAGLIIFWPHVF